MARGNRNTHNNEVPPPPPANTNNEVPPPPPPVTLEQVLAMQAQLLHSMQQSMMNMQQNQSQQQNQNQQQAPPPRDRLGDFQRTKPPTFSHSVDPLDADDWLKTVEKKQKVVQCTDREMVLYASQLQIGGKPMLKLMNPPTPSRGKSSVTASGCVTCPRVLSN